MPDKRKKIGGIPSSPTLFGSSRRRSERISAKPNTRNVILDTLSDTNVSSTSSFRYDSVGSGLKSTQEIEIDWEKFENHTFFNSAQSKVNIAFHRIINEYPFEGSIKQVEAFEDSLTGYEKYILDSFPKNNGYLIFSGTSETENPAGGFSSGLGTYISVIDSAGSQFPNFSTNTSGQSIINFEENPFSIELMLYVPKAPSYNQIVCQKRDTAARAITIALSQSASTSKVPLIFSISSGSAKIIASSSIEKGKFSHICATYDRDSTDKLHLFLSQTLVATSSTSYEFESLSFSNSNFIIGSGSTFHASPLGKTLPGSTSQIFTPTVTFSGSMDELRLFHSTRDIEDQKKYERRIIHLSNNSKSLKLYYKFNEPSGSYDGNNVVLDSSGNSLHSIISNYSILLRETGSSGEPGNPMYGEKPDRSPVLFPDFHLVKTLNSRLLTSASSYDNINPNIVTRLFPSHYLLDGQQYQGFSKEEGLIGDPVSGNSIPGSAKIGNAQNLTAFMLIWAKFYDEIKIFIDHMSNILNVSYDDEESVARKLLPFVAQYYGIELPAIFPDARINQYILGEDLENSYETSLNSLQFIQTEIWKRILINYNDIRFSKGTIHSVKSLIRAAGINPDNLMAIREYGGPTKRSLEGRRETKTEVASSIDFSGSYAEVAAGTLNPQGFSSKFPNIVSNFLSGSRIEVGFPEPSGSIAFVNKRKFPPHGISRTLSDGLFTSGSFTYEAIYQFPRKSTIKYDKYQSLVRLHISASNTGSKSELSKGIHYANLLLVSGTENSLTSSGSTLRLYMRPGNTSKIKVDPLLRLELTGVNIFDGNLWNISFGRERSDQKRINDSGKYITEPISFIGSSSYFLRAARQTYGSVENIFVTSSFFKADKGGATSSGNILQAIDAIYNPSGSMIVIGSQSMANVSSTGKNGSFGDSYNRFLIDPNLDSVAGAATGDSVFAKSTNFFGQVSQIRFWSKALEIDSWKEHVRNFKSLGVSNPLVHFNFEKKATGSFGRLRLDVSTDQQITGSDSSGNISLFDFSQNEIYMSGSGFEPSSLVIKPETFYFSHLSPRFDLSQTNNKVRIRGLAHTDLIDENRYSRFAPVHEILKSEEPDDDTRFAIEFSSVKALDEDIMNMFGNLTFFDNALGRPNLLFDDIYPDLDQARKIYFNRVTEKLNYKIFFNMYRWFNSSLGLLIEDLVPRKTKFLGINFVIESHVLERSRFRYLFDEIYLKALARDTSRGNLLLSQIVGNLCKY